jgi:hypothetical protein
MNYKNLASEAFTILGSLLNETENATKETVVLLKSKYYFLDTSIIENAVSEAFERWISIYNKDD